MEREIIELNDFDIALLLDEYANEMEQFEECFDEDGNPIPGYILDDFEFIEEATSYVDLEKSYEDVEVIVRRKSDGKFFKGEYSSSPYCGKEFDNNTLKEVFPVEVTTTIYQ